MMFTQIRKPAARKLFDNGKPVWITAANMRPECGIRLNSDVYKNDTTTFDQLCNAFAYYNCNNETGRYPRFYIEEEQSYINPL